MSDLNPLDLLDIDALLTDEERQIRDLARTWVRDRILPEVEDWYERRGVPRARAGQGARRAARLLRDAAR